MELIRFKQYITESTELSTQMEHVLCFCINNTKAKTTKKTFEKIVNTDPVMVSFIKEALKSKDFKIGSDPIQTLYSFGIQLNEFSEISGNKADSGSGQTKKGLSTFWYDITTKQNDTSKADINIGNMNVSVKNTKAQLMSGVASESKATVMAALSISTLDKKLQKDIIQSLDNFKSNIRTSGEEMTTAALRKLGDENKILKSDKINKQAYSLLKEADVIKDQTVQLFSKAFKNTEFRNSFAYEAATGKIKFDKKMGGDSSGIAEYFLIWSPDFQTTKFENIKSINSKKIKQIADQMKLSVDPKSNSIKGIVDGKKSKIGYNFSQTIRLAYNEVIKKTNESIEQYDNLLLENKYISENIIKNIIDTIVNAFKKFITFLVDSISDAIKVISESFEELMNYFELDFDVTINENQVFEL